MSETVSNDGTKIAFDSTGDGPPVILVVGAFNDRATGAPLARALEGRLSVINYDRRGRGNSGDTQPYAVEREVEDLHALIQEAGGEASVFGYSSGANLALEGAIRGLKITKLAMYEPAFVDDTVPDLPKDIATQLEKLVTTGRRGDAVELFQTRLVGMPESLVAQMRNAPFRPALEAIAHTLVYDAKVVGNRKVPAARARSVTMPTLVVYGAAGPTFMSTAAKALAAAIPDGQVHGLEGQVHDIVPEALAPVLLDFLVGR